MKQNPSKPEPPDSDAEMNQLAFANGKAIRRLVRTSDRIDNVHFRNQAMLRLERQRAELELLADGRVIFESTETWRAVYEDVLSTCETKRYLSVAVVQSEDYWRCLPGERSVTFNGTLVDRGFYAHRIFIIDDFLWPPGAKVPSKDLYAWIVRQYRQGIQIGVLRASDVQADPELIRDFGIYGRTAVGYQSTDELGKTIRYDMHFGENHVRLGEDRWKRLSLYSRPFESLQLT